MGTIIIIFLIGIGIFGPMIILGLWFDRVEKKLEQTICDLHYIKREFRKLKSELRRNNLCS